jgi:hypothetical protein
VLSAESSSPLLMHTVVEAATAVCKSVSRLEIADWNPYEVGSYPTVVEGGSPIDNDPLALAAMNAADLVIDLVFLLFTPGQREVLQSGTRMLLAYHAPAVLARVMPTLADRERALAAKAATPGAGVCTSLRRRASTCCRPRRTRGPAHHTQVFSCRCSRVSCQWLLPGDCVENSAASPRFARTRGGGTHDEGSQDGEQEQLFYSFSLEDHVPKDHLLRGIDASWI